METSDAERSPLLNHVVLVTLKELVDCPSVLRSYRNVNRQWLAICNKKAIELSTVQGVKRIISPFPNGFGYSHVIPPAEDASVRSIQRLNVNDEVEFLDHVDVHSFFQTMGNQLQFLSFEHAENEMMSVSHLKFIENVIYEWCHNLEELRLVGFFQNEVEVPDRNESKNSISLRKLMLDYTQSEFTSVNLVGSVIRRIILRAGNLESFIYVGYKRDPLLHEVPVELMRLINVNVRNLTTIELWDVSLKERVLSLITGAEWPLRKFVYRGRPDSDVHIRHFNLFLDAHTKTLKHLHLSFHWICVFEDGNVELNVHTLENLQVLKVAVQNVNVGSSGLLGNLEKLRYLTLRGSTAAVSRQLDIETMFREKKSTSLKSLDMDKTYARCISSIRSCCPNVTELEVRCLARNVDSFTRDLKVLVCEEGVLEDLAVTVEFEDFEIYNEDFVESLIIGLFSHSFRVLSVGTSHSRNNFPWLRLDWIKDGLFPNRNSYYRIELKRFFLRDDELARIGNILSDRANFVTLIDCKINATQTGGVLDLSEATFYRDNVGEVIKNIIENAQLQERVVVHYNYDPYAVLKL